MKPVLLALALALLGCIAGLALAEDAPRQSKQPPTKTAKAPETKPAPRDATIYREDVTLEEMQRYHP